MREIKSRYERNRVIVEFEGSAGFPRTATRLRRRRTSPATRRSASSRTATRRSCCTRPRRWRPSTASSWSSLRSKRSSSRPWEARPMRNMLLIARREYLEQIRGRAFRLSTILAARCYSSVILGVSCLHRPQAGHRQAHRHRRRQRRAGRRRFAPACSTTKQRTLHCGCRRSGHARRIAPTLIRRSRRTNPSTACSSIENSASGSARRSPTSRNPRATS